MDENVLSLTLKREGMITSGGSTGMGSKHMTIR